MRSTASHGIGGNGKSRTFRPARTKRVGDTFEAAELRREEIHAFRVAFTQWPLLAAPPCDQLPQLEVIAGDVIGSLSELHLITATR